MKHILFAFFLFLANNLLAETWEINIGKDSIHYTTSDQSIKYPTILIVRTESVKDNLQIKMQGKDGSEIVFSSAMSQLADTCNQVRALEPRMQNFVGFVKRHLESI